MTINLPKDVEYILNSLHKKGFDAYVVGGCVRDVLMGKYPNDWDITTNALPSDIKSIFKKTIDTGLAHGTVTVLKNDIPYEITTFRIDGKYINNRKPESVVFTPDIEIDLSRRDFTVNSMAYNHKAGLIDMFGGQNDIRCRTIRTVGQPDKRFCEDALRMLRAVRFAAQLDFEIAEKTILSIKKNNALIKHISMERIRDEITGILMSTTPQKIDILFETGIMAHIMPEVCRGNFSIYTSEKVCIYDALKMAEQQVQIRWTIFLSGFTGRDKVNKAVYVMRMLKFDKKTIKKVALLLKNLDIDIKDTAVSVRRAAAVVGPNYFEKLLDLRKVFSTEQNEIQVLSNIRNIWNVIKEDRQCLTLSQLAVSGDDIINLGIRGRDIGYVLNKLLDMVIENPERNNKKDLLEAARMLNKQA